MQARVEVAAVDAAMVVFEARVDKTINQRVHALRARVLAGNPPWLVDVVAAYHTLMVVYDVQTTEYAVVERFLNKKLHGVSDQELAHTGTLHEFKVCYDAELGMDLSRVSELTGLSTSVIIERHSAPTYHVYTIGFAPGFAYLGDVAEGLQVPRQSTPRTKVPAGSVAIANQQTAIYPRPSPGGWNIIGRVAGWQFETGLTMQAGDQVKFIPISRAEYDQLEQQARERTND